jgi:hypothetical protein
MRRKSEEERRGKKRGEMTRGEERSTKKEKEK